MAKYSKKIVKHIVELMKSDTYTIAEICRIVDIAPRTFYDWQSENEEFAQALEQAKAERMQYFVAEAKKSLLKKIQGYTVDETKTVYSNNKDNKPVIKEQTIIKKHVQPDTGAIIFTLTNVDRENWKNSKYVEADIATDKERIASLFPTKEEVEEVVKKHLDGKNNKP